MKKNIKWIICFTSLIIFLILGYLVKTNNELILVLEIMVLLIISMVLLINFVLKMALFL